MGETLKYGYARPVPERPGFVCWVITDAFASKPAPTLDLCRLPDAGLHKPPVGAGLLAKAVERAPQKHL
ncbi:hypothetical protein D3C80_2023600 [compost metagenome]